MEGYVQEKHEMVFERAVGEEAEELFCPVCGRRILVQWSPDFRKTVLAPGNENAFHTASRSGSGPGELPGLPVEQPVMTPATADPARLADWERCLREIGFEHWWR